MFKIYDGREKFYQWDLNRKLIIEDSSINQVHFCNKTDDCSLVCDVYEEAGARLVNVPNILLQETWRINVYAYDKEYTKHCAKFDVVARSKPESYVYTETEVNTWNELEERLAYLEENGTGGSGGTGEAGGYYIPNVDSIGNLTWSASKESMPPVAATNIKGDRGDSGIYVGNTEPTDDYLIWINPEAAAPEYATKEYVSEAIANIDIPESSGGGSGASVFVFENTTLSTLTDQEKEMAAYLFAYVKEYKKPPEDYIFYFKGGSWAYIAQEMHYDNRGLVIINCELGGGSQNQQFIIGADSNGICTSFNWYAQALPTAEKWNWEASENLYINGIATSHIKIVGYFQGITDLMVTFDISAYANNYFYEEYGAKYYVPNVYGCHDNALLCFENSGEYLTLQNADTGSYFADDEFKPKGFFYWG